MILYYQSATKVSCYNSTLTQMCYSNVDQHSSTKSTTRETVTGAGCDTATPTAHHCGCCLLHCFWPHFHPTLVSFYTQQITKWKWCSCHHSSKVPDRSATCLKNGWLIAVQEIGTFDDFSSILPSALQKNRTWFTIMGHFGTLSTDKTQQQLYIFWGQLYT